MSITGLILSIIAIACSVLTFDKAGTAIAVLGLVFSVVGHLKTRKIKSNKLSICIIVISCICLMITIISLWIRSDREYQVLVQDMKSLMEVYTSIQEAIPACGESYATDTPGYVEVKPDGSITTDEIVKEHLNIESIELKSRQYRQGDSVIFDIKKSDGQYEIKCSDKSIDVLIKSKN